MKKVYMFDLDGTLVDSIEPFIKGFYDFLGSYNIACNDEIVTKIISLGYDKGAEYFVELGVPEEPKELSIKMQQQALERYKTSIFTKPHVNEYLRKLKSDGHSLYVLTASPHLLADPCLKNNGIYELFDAVFTVGEDFLYTKSDPKLFKAVADKISATPSDINYFDDNLHAILNAKLNGFVTYAIKDLQSETNLKRLKENADYFISSFKELI
jgi:HAD superfamily hydrolase (TIGR01509 family)